MKLEAYRFFEDDILNDQEKVFAWFFTKIHGMDSDIDASYTIAKYDLQMILRGSCSGAFAVNNINKDVTKWVNIGFVNDTRAILILSRKAKQVFRHYKGDMLCGKKCLEITSEKAIRLHYYLLGILNASNDMFYEASNFGQGNVDAAYYRTSTKLLNHIEIRELMNA